MSDNRHLGDSIFGDSPTPGTTEPAQSGSEVTGSAVPRDIAPEQGHAADGATGSGRPGTSERGGSGPGAPLQGATSAPEPGGRRTRPRGRRVVVSLLALVLVIAAGAAAWAGLSPVVAQFTSAKDYPGPGTGSVTVTVNPGDTGRDIGATLSEAGVIQTADAFTDALAANPGDDVQPGSYTLKKQMSAAGALSALRQGARNVVKVTLREGLWKSEVFAALAKATGRPVSDYTAAETAIKKNPSLVGLPSSAKGNLEGYLFPATYSFDPGTGAVAQLRELVSKSVAQLRALGVAQADMEKIVTIASIVEAEARLDADRPKVARVIDNRLAINMPLQLDSTVSYGVQRRALTTTDAERAAKNGYNTYLHPGLPAGPIGNPGAASITAAQQPAAGKWLYFVTINPVTGQTVFSTTLAEHNASVLQFQKWCQANPGKC